MSGVASGFGQPVSTGAQAQPFELAFQELLRALHELVATPDLQQQVAFAYAQYAQVAEAGLASADMQRLAPEAYMRYLGVLQQAIASGHTRDAAADAFRKYVGAVREAWSGTNPDAVDPPALAAIGQTLTAAGWLAFGFSPGSPVPVPPASR